MANFKLKESANKVSVGTALAGVNIIPQTGFIMPFAGTTAPSGWALCDGLNGTPDLKGHFIIGASSSANIGTATGSANHTHSYTFSNINVSEETNVSANRHTSALVPNVLPLTSSGVSHTHTYSAGVDTPSYYSGNFINWSNGNTTTRTFRSHDHVGTTNTMTTSATTPGSHLHNKSTGTLTNGTITETAHKHNVGTAPSGTTNAGETIPGNIIMNYIIKL